MDMAIAVVDDGGLLVYFERIDETQFGSIDIAIGKARTAASLNGPPKPLRTPSTKVSMPSFPSRTSSLGREVCRSSRTGRSSAPSA